MSTSAGRDKKAGYEAFGSFHTASPDALFAGEAFKLPPPRERFPPLPSHSLVTARAPSPGAAPVAQNSNRRHFTIDFGAWTYLNHGAFGGATRFATDVAAAWRAFADAQPLRFHDRLLFPYIVQSIAALAAFVNVRDAQELVLLPNATTGLHAVLHSVLTAPAPDGDASATRDRVVVCFSTRYGAVRKMLQTIGDDALPANVRLRVHEEPLSLAESYDDAVVLERLERVLETLAKDDRARCALVVVDHITSNTGVLLPVDAITQLCHRYNAPVLVDGAHSLLNLPLDVSAINADYYVGNCHKWFSAPRGAGFLHVNTHTGVASTRAVAIRPRVVSHGYLDGYQSAFMWLGLQDYSAWLALPECIAYWEHQGVAACRTYMHTLAQDATELLYSTWGMSDELERAQRFPAHKRHAMRLVKLPPGRVFGVPTSLEATSADAKFIQDTLHQAFGIEVPIKCVDAQLYVRISAHMYNSLDEYAWLADVLQAAREHQSL